MGWVSVLFGVSAGVVFAIEKSKAKRFVNRDRTYQQPEEATKLNLNKEGTDFEDDEKEATNPAK